MIDENIEFILVYLNVALSTDTSMNVGLEMSRLS